MTPRPIDFYFDFSSPYSYMASEWVDALAARHGRTVRWHAILLGATFQAAGLKPPVDYPLKREYVLLDFARSARLEGLPYVQPARFPISTQNAARLFWWLHDTRDAIQARRWATTGLRAYFTRGIDLSDPLLLKALAAQFGLAPQEAEAVWNEPSRKARLKQANDGAIAAGVFGAPFFIIDGEPFWGNDRKLQIERFLAGERGAFQATNF
jgi:2-hydroxychromene-2-carboxylate isomerase